MFERLIHYREMVKFCCLLFLGLLLSQALFSQERDMECKGFFRWDVKTLTDKPGIDLLSAIVHNSSFDLLVSERPPSHLSVLSAKDGRLPRFDDEQQVVKVVAFIQKVKIQKDRDLHILLKSTDTNKSMIGEIPDPECGIFDAIPELRRTYAEARRQLQQVTDQINTNHKPVLVEITGVPFWDARHWWLRGCARNGREIHPILFIKILSED